jgi:hypothetical protein
MIKKLRNRWHEPPGAMKSLKYPQPRRKNCRFRFRSQRIPFIDTKIGVIVFAAASLLKNIANRIGDLLDDGKPNSSFKSSILGIYFFT